jgi:hypothetical protein
MSFFFYLKKKVEIFGKFHFSSINLTMFPKFFGNIHQNFGITKLKRKTMLQRDTSAPTFFWAEFCKVITNVFGIFSIFKSVNLEKLPNFQNQKIEKIFLKKNPHPVLVVNLLLLTRSQLGEGNSSI